MLLFPSSSWQYLLTLSFTSPLCHFLSFFLFLFIALTSPLLSHGHYTSPPHTCAPTHFHKYTLNSCGPPTPWITHKKHTNTNKRKPLTNNKKRKIHQITDHKSKHTLALPFTASLPVGVSLPSVGGAAALCYTSSATVRFSPTAFTLTAAATFRRRPAPFCHSRSLRRPTVVLQSAILLHSSHHMTGLPSALFAKLIATIRAGSGDVIQFNSRFLKARVTISQMCVTGLGSVEEGTID